MKSKGLYIIVFSFLFSLLLSANRSDGKTAHAAYPHTEKHILKSGINPASTEAGFSFSGERKGTVHSYRIHGHGSAVLSEFTPHRLLSTHYQKIAGKENFSCKAYLDHLYPSHNFW
jgi:hypothetical protein